jgi:hypothetical protein
MCGGKTVVVKESPSGSGRYEIVVDPGTYLVLVKKVGYAVAEETISTRPGIQGVNVCALKAECEEDGWDPIKEAIERKGVHKP